MIEQSGQRRDRRRLVWTVQHVGPGQEEKHRWGVGQDAGRSFEKVGRYQNKIRILGQKIRIFHLSLNKLWWF